MVAKKTKQTEKSKVGMSSYLFMITFIGFGLFFIATYFAIGGDDGLAVGEITSIDKKFMGSYFGYNLCAIIVFYLFYVAIVAQDVLNINCQEKKAKQSVAWLGSLPILFAPMIVIMLLFIPQTFSVFGKSFVDMAGGLRMGISSATAINVVGFLWTAHVISYYSVIKSGCGA